LCQVIFLPSYSPQFNPIESAFSKVKKFLRRHLSKLLSAGFTLPDAISVAFKQITSADCIGWTESSRYDL
jgi:transposase